MSASHWRFSTRRSRLSGVIDRYNNNRVRTGTATDDGLGAAAPLAKTRPQQVQRTCGAPQFPCACHVMERQPRRHEPRPMAMIFETFTMHVPTATACLGAVGMSEARRCHLQREEELWGRTQTPGRVADYATSNRVSTCVDVLQSGCGHMICVNNGNIRIYQLKQIPTSELLIF